MIALVDHVFSESILWLRRTLILRTIDLLTHVSRSMPQIVSPIEGHFMLTTTGETKDNTGVVRMLTWPLQ